MQPEELFTPANIAAVSLATLAVNVATLTIQKLFRVEPKWTAIVAALVIAYLVVAMKTTPAWYEWVLAFFNACLLFCSALGLNELGAAAAKPPGTGFVSRAPLLTSWLPKKS